MNKKVTDRGVHRNPVRWLTLATNSTANELDAIVPSSPSLYGDGENTDDLFARIVRLLRRQAQIGFVHHALNPFATGLDAILKWPALLG